MRPTALAALIVSLLLAAVCALPDGAAHAQRRQRQQPRAESNDNSAQRRREPAKRVVVAGSSDTAQGTRQTIKADNPLNDYSAYRSGDRFYVVLPKSDASAVSRGSSGRGYSDMQVQQRGEDVVLSYRLKPGAKPRVEQKFNRLDVVFEVPEGGQQAPQQSAQQQQAARAAQQQPAQTPAQAQQQQNAARQQAAAQGANAAGQGQQPAAQTAGQQSTPQQSQPSVVPADPSAGGQQAAPGAGLPPVDAQAGGGVAPAEGQAPPQEIAQAQPPVTAPAGSATAGTAGATGAQSGTSIGSVVLNNWPIALAALLALVGLGLVIAARRSSALSAPPDSEAALLAGEPAALRAGEAKTAGAGAVVKPAEAGPAAAKPVEAKAGAVEAGAALVGAAAAKGASAAPESKREAARAKDAGKVEDKGARKAQKTVEATEAAKALKTSEAPETAGASAADESETETSIAPVVAGLAGVAASGAVAASGSSKEIAPVVAAPDPDRVQAETKRLLEGGDYDRAVVGNADQMARQMVAAELLSALAGRQPERRERARAAFSEHGYFDDLLRDLREASAPAERAAAARSLGLVGDTKASRPLVVALEDNSVDVRRAAVESLAALRDPQAVPALEALIKREKKLKHRVNRKLVENAIEVSLLAAAEPAHAQTAAPAGLAEVEATAAPAEEAAQVEETARAEAPAQTEESTAMDLFAPAGVPAPTEETALTEAPAPAEAVTRAEVAEQAEAADLTAISPADPDLTVEAVAPVEAGAAAEADAAVEADAGVEELTVEVAPPVRAEEAAGVTDAPAAPVAEAEALPAVAEEETAAGLFAAGPRPPADSFVTAEATAPAPGAGVVAEDSAEGSVEEAPAEVFAAADAPAGEFTFGEDFAERAAVEDAPAGPAVTDTAVDYESIEEVVPAAASAGEAATAGAPADEVAFADAPGDVFAEVAPAEEAGADEPAAAMGGADESPAGFVLERGRDERAEAAAEEWVEFDISDASGPEPSATVADIAPVIETSSGQPLEAPARGEDEAAASRAEVRGLEPVGGPDEMEPAPAREPEAPAFGRRGEVSLAVPGGPIELTAPESPATAWAVSEKGIELFDADSTVPASIQQRLASAEPAERAAAVAGLSRLPKDESFRQICAAFDDEAQEVRSAAARALYDHDADRAECFTRALRESAPERRRQIGAAINSSGLASEAISQLTGESREKTYEAFSILFLMAKAGEVQPLLRAVEGHPNNEVRLAVVKLLALSGQKEILPAFRRLAVRGSLPTEVRSAVMEAIYQISSQSETTHA